MQQIEYEALEKAWCLTTHQLEQLRTDAVADLPERDVDTVLRRGDLGHLRLTLFLGLLVFALVCVDVREPCYEIIREPMRVLLREGEPRSRDLPQATLDRLRKPSPLQAVVGPSVAVRIDDLGTARYALGAVDDRQLQGVGNAFMGLACAHRRCPLGQKQKER
jgi:hypothetical protein